MTNFSPDVMNGRTNRCRLEEVCYLTIDAVLMPTLVRKQTLLGLFLALSS